VIYLIGDKMAKDYTDVGLNDRLQNITSIPARRGTESFNPPTDFESQVERGAVTTSKMGTIDAKVITSGSMLANRIYGGTLTLGGTANVSGVFSLQDEGGTERISMTKDGMVVNDGSVTIKDSAGSNVIDSKGLVSETSFESGEQEGNPSQGITSGTYVDITGATLTTSNFSRTRKVLVLAKVDSYLSPQNGYYAGELEARIEIDGTLGGGIYHRGFSSEGDSSAVDRLTHSTFDFQDLGAGTHVIKLVGRTNQYGVGNTTGMVGSFRLGYIVLGK